MSCDYTWSSDLRSSHIGVISLTRNLLVKGFYMCKHILLRTCKATKTELERTRGTRLFNRNTAHR